MLYMALIHIDENTLAMTDADTGEALDAVAVIPGHAPDLAKLVNMLSPEEAVELERMAAARSEGLEVNLSDLGS